MRTSHRRLLFVLLMLAILFIARQFCDGAANPAWADTSAALPATAPVNDAEAHIAAKVHSSQQLNVFGADFFRADASLFLPNPETPAPDDYQLGTGDALSVVCWYGSAEYEHATVKITPEGSVYLKLLGAIVVARKQLGQLREELRTRYAAYYKHFSLTVELVGQRTMPVYVLGEVQKPGKYLLSSMATAFTALYSAGGPNAIGSLRHIRVMRGVREVGEIDVYNYLLFGKNVDLALQPGDTVYVPPVNATITLTGAVRRPARYEAPAGITLAAALELAGGRTPTGANRIQVIRADAEHGHQLLDLHLSADASFPLQNGDIAETATITDQVANAVYLYGAVYRPGEYTIENAPRISALIKLADGVTSDAYLLQAHLTRQLDNNEQTLIPVDLQRALAGDAQADIPLRPRDLLVVYARSELVELLDRVTIEGEVLKPGVYPYHAGMTLNDLVAAAFGITKNAYLPQVLLYRFDEKTGVSLLAVDLSRSLAGAPAANVPLSPRDKVVIRSIAETNYQQVEIAGEVVKPGVFAYYPGMKITDVLLLANGVTHDTALDRALLYRRNTETSREEVVDISLRNALAHQPSADIALCNHDRLVVFSTVQAGDFAHVSIEGAVTAPGDYAYAPGMRLSQLLYLAKNLSADAYTTRADLFRYAADNTMTIIPVDLRKALVGAQDDDNPALQPRDRLLVGTIAGKVDRQRVKIDGFVRTPGTFALAEGMKVSDLLDLGCGLLAEAELTAYLYRRVQGKETVTPIPLRKDGEKILVTRDTALQADDLVTLKADPDYARATDTFRIEGEVAHPSSYPVFEQGRSHPCTLYQALARAGGLLPNAYAPGIVLYRKQSAIQDDTRRKEVALALTNLDAANGLVPAAKAMIAEKPEIDTPAHPSATQPAEGTPNKGPTATPPATVAQEQSVNNLSHSLAQTLTTNADSSVVLVIPPRSLNQQEYRLSIPIDAKEILASNGKVDFKLEPDDLIYIPRQPTTVTVIGGVVTAGSVLYAAGNRLLHYINSVGGFAVDADKAHAVVVHMNGHIQPVSRSSVIQPGDTIIVPTKHVIKLLNKNSSFERSLRVFSDMAITSLSFLAYSKL